MGWTVDESWDNAGRLVHEGYFSGTVQLNGEYGEWLEVGPKDSESHDLTHVHVSCTCGWRSRRLFVPMGTEWMPCCVLFASQADEDRWSEVGFALWRPHIDEWDKSSLFGYELKLAYPLKVASRSGE